MVRKRINIKSLWNFRKKPKSIEKTMKMSYNILYVKKKNGGYYE